MGIQKRIILIVCSTENEPMFSRGDSPCTVGKKKPNKKQADPQTCGLSALRFNTFTLTLFMLHNVFCSSAQTLNLCSLLWNYDISLFFFPALKIDLGTSCTCKDMKAENSGNVSVRLSVHFLKGLSLLGSVGGSKLSQVTPCTAHQFWTQSLLPVSVNHSLKRAPLIFIP